MQQANNTNTTQWRDKKILPDGYEKVELLIPLVRKARQLLVDFDWVFTRDDLCQLREAVFGWGHAVKGRFQAFDALVVAAINDCLDEHDTIYELQVPTNASGWCQVTCVERDGVFHLSGYANFDVIFGYGRVCSDDTSVTRLRMSTELRARLVATVGSLGWDILRLQEPRLRPVLNTLYGLPPDYAPVIGPVINPHLPSLEVAVGFQGPFSVFESDDSRNLFTAPTADKIGVYLWTINVNGRRLPWYVGQTRRGFAARMGEHLANYLSGRYSVYRAEDLAQGRYHVLWRPNKGSAQWPHTLPQFLGDFDRLKPDLMAMLRLVEFHCAPLDCEKHVLDRVEGTIGRYFKNRPEREVHSFFSPSIHLPSHIPIDRRVKISVTSEAEICSLPVDLPLESPQ